MTQPQDVVRGHGFDDITEFDNRLPNWWLWSFYLACIFSLFYWIHYQVLRTGPNAQQEFAAEQAAFEAKMAAVVVPDDVFVARVADPAVVAEGRAIFTTNCIACHAADGGAMLTVEGQAPVQLPGPNLTDKFWIHGGRPSDIYNTIMKGVPNTAMVAWGSLLGARKCQDVAVYVLTMRNTNVKGGKDAQGQEYAGN